MIRYTMETIGPAGGRLEFTHEWTLDEIAKFMVNGMKDPDVRPQSITIVTAENVTIKFEEKKP